MSQSRNSPPQASNSGRADLHLHSTASDGVYKPAKVMQMATARSLAAVALTDHDTVAGLAEAREAAQALGMQFINGIEIDAAHHRGTMHILGYFIDPTSESLTTFLNDASQRRANRNLKVISLLNENGVSIQPEEIIPDGDLLRMGRRQIASALIRKGVVSNPTAAFRDYLGIGGKAFVSLDPPSPIDVIRAIRSAGGAAVLAHPVTLQCESFRELEILIARLKHNGLAGIETGHPAMPSHLVRELSSLAKRMSLIETGGSDFHSLNIVQHRGTGFGPTVDLGVVKQIEQACSNSISR